jgi:hypothetical protein
LSLKRKNSCRRSVGNDDDWRLLLAWLTACFRPTGPFPLLALAGEQGSAKSTTAKVLRSLIDPNSALLRAEPGETRDLMIAANGSWLLVFDNLSHLNASLSDALCGLSTGRGFSTRRLYTDEEEHIFQASRPVILTSIVDVAQREDLLDRTIILRLPAIPDERRQAESEFSSAFESARPALFGALLDLVAGALRELPTVKLNSKPRMADFAAWGIAVERAAGWPEGSFLAAYFANIDEAVSVALDTLLPDKLRELVKPAIEQQGQWKGTATELLNQLNASAGEQATRARDWPKSANQLSAALKRLAPALRRAKHDPLDVVFERATSKDRKRFILIKPAKRADGTGRTVDGPGKTPSEDRPRAASAEHATSADGTGAPDDGRCGRSCLSLLSGEGVSAGDSPLDSLSDFEERENIVRTVRSSADPDDTSENPRGIGVPAVPDGGRSADDPPDDPATPLSIVRQDHGANCELAEHEAETPPDVFAGSLGFFRDTDGKDDKASNKEGAVHSF